jgi:rubrerythrin
VTRRPKQGFHRVFRAIVVGVSAPTVWIHCNDDPQMEAIDAEADATSIDGATANDAAADVPLDSYVAWCEAGPPDLLGAADSCHHYFYVPCGLPEGDVTDDAGVVNRCDQVCVGYTDDQCAILPPPWPSVLMDAGFFADASLVDGGVFILCACIGASGRMPEGLREPRVQASSPLGAYFARMAHLEAASVPAFERMHDELRALGAPRRLLARVRRAINDEQRHARVVSGVARRFGGQSTLPCVRPFRARTVEAIARENAVEGCARETYGALVATWQAHHARDPLIRRVMTRIAEDESRHAELAWATARFLSRHLDARARRRVDRARRCAMTVLSAELPDVDGELADRAGVPAKRAARRLLERLERVLRSGINGKPDPAMKRHGSNMRRRRCLVDRLRLARAWR